MLRHRLPSGIVLGAVILSSIFWDGNAGRCVFLLFGSFLSFAAVMEFLGMLDKMGMKSFPKVTATFSALVLAGVVLNAPPLAYAAGMTAAIVVAWLTLLPVENRVSAVARIVNSLSVLPLLVFPLTFLALIYRMEDCHISGRLMLFFMILVTKSGDIGAYSIGTMSARLMPGGNHKILPGISPKKSWEGTIGGLMTSLAASFAFCSFVPTIFERSLGPIFFPLTAGALLFVGGFVGDLVESALKRAADVKDSGNMIPGMGGALDVIDSLVLNAPLFYLFLRLQ